MMNNKIIFSGLAVLVVVTAVMVLNRGQETEVRCQEAGVRAQRIEVGDQMSEISVSQSAMQLALESPDEFQERDVEQREAPKPLVVPADRPKQLSEVERQGTGDGGQGSERRPVAASDLYFWKDYKSLRKDEIRNPDSKENREGVVQLMKARQRRVEKK